MDNPADNELNELAAGIKQSDRHAFDQLFRYLYPQLVHFAYKYMHDRDAACDIVQDAFVLLWQTRQNIDSSRSLKAYLFKIVRNRALNYIRDYYGKTTELNTDKIHEDRDLSIENIDHHKHKEMSKKFDEWIDQLPERQREAFELSRYDGLDHKEIASVMDVSIKTVNNHIVEALRKLRSSYDLYLNEMNSDKNG
ncbi:MAG: RNA polymerase sigma-70 factor [Balneolaceae bacterium]